MTGHWTTRLRFWSPFIGIEEGSATGVLLSLMMVIYRSTRPHVAVLGRLPGTPTPTATSSAFLRPNNAKTC